MNSIAITASLASGGSIIGVMGLAYSQGIPATLALFAGAVLGFPLASVLVAKQLRNFGKYTITDFLAFRYPHAVVKYLVPSVIVIAFTIYIVAQLKAAGITANALLGIPYNTAVAIATLVFVIYVSFGGMIAITWTDVVQGLLMLVVVVGTSLFMMWRLGSPADLMQQATAAAPELGLRGASGYSHSTGRFHRLSSSASSTPQGLDYSVRVSLFLRSLVCGGEGPICQEVLRLSSQAPQPMFWSFSTLSRSAWRRSWPH